MATLFCRLRARAQRSSVLALCLLGCSNGAPAASSSSATASTAAASSSVSSSSPSSQPKSTLAPKPASSAPGHVASALPASKVAAGEPVDADGDGDGDGLALDLDNDGKVDAVDIDGDGDADGVDVNGDGIITIWSELGFGLKRATKQSLQRQFEQPDPDFYDDLDKSFKGEHTINGEVTIEPRADVSDGLRALNQGDQGSCSAFALAAGATLVRGARESVDPNKVFASPAFIYERLRRGEDPPIDCNEGTPIAYGLGALVREGSASLAEVPYLAEQNALACAVGSTASQGHLYRLGGYETMLPVTQKRIKETISAGLPVVIGVTLPPGFDEWHGEAAKGVFKGQGECTDSVHCGGHAMLITGYDDDKQAYRILNSWGEDWGDLGYFWWDYADLEARDPEAYILIEDPDPKPFAAPNAAAFAIEPVGETVVYKDEESYNVVVRVRATEPIRITKVTITPQGGEPFEDAEVDVWLSYSDVTFFAGDAPPAQGDAQATIEGELRDGSKVQKTLKLKLESPETSLD